MTKEQKKYCKSFAESGMVYNVVKEYLLSFGVIDTDAPVAEIGARYIEREKLKKELHNKFKSMSFLIDES